jgi:phosphonopyruvate decarboxylase
VIDPREFLRLLRGQGVTYFAGVPDSLLQDFCASVADDAGPGEHLVAANEGGAVASAIGYHLATGRTPLVYMQNSGLGNALNPLLSLADPSVYAVPMLLLIGWRGEPGTPDEPQHRKQGAVTLALLEAAQIPHTVVDAHTAEAEGLLRSVLERPLRGPHALVVRKGTFAAYPAEAPKTAASLRREDVIGLVVESVEPADVMVASTGVIARELYACRARRGQGHERDFLVIGGMGHASQIAHTLAAHRRGGQVYCLDGDGAVLMHMGALALIGANPLGSFRHLVLNNGTHESVGGQPTVGLSVDFPALGRALGYAAAGRVATLDELPRALSDLRRAAGPALLEIRVATGHRADLGRPASAPADDKQALMNHLRS